MSRKHVLVTGAAGFIGSHCVDRLLENGYRVTGVDDFSKGSEENLKDARRHHQFTLMKVNICSPRAVHLLDHPYDCILHLAAIKIPRYGKRLETMQQNIDGVRTCLEIARRRKTRFIFASTSDVYGMNPDVPFGEDGFSVIGPSTSARWGYAVSKLAGEHLCFGYAERYSLPVTIIRYFGSYGPREHRSWWGGAPSVFIERLLDGRPIEVHGDGRQTRCLTYIDDIVRGTIAVLQSEKLDSEIINLGSTEEVSMIALARKICVMMKEDPKQWITFLPYKKLPSRDYQDVRRRVPSLAKAGRLLRYRPRISLEEGLRKTIAWHQSMRNV